MPALLATQLLTVVALLLSELRSSPRAGAVAKLLASANFVALALVAGLADGGVAPALVLAGLCCGAVGDALLLSRTTKLFLAGLVAFLLNHLLYAAAFLAMGVTPSLVVAAALPLAAGGLVVWRWLRPHVGRLGAPVAAYVVTICAMVALASGAAGATGRVGLLAGAALFFVSDLFVARNRFIDRHPTNRLLGLPLYYGAQVTLVLAVR